jgi:hypothetical protein
MLSLALLLLAAAPAQSDHPKTFLLSLGSIPVPRDEIIENFAFSTWGVTFKSVCRIPPGWTIKAGGSLTPEGIFEGYGSLGVSMPRSASPTVFRSLVLVELYAPVQRRDIRFPKNSGEIPATFKGHATLSDGDSERKVPLTYRNVKLVPARSCPPS